MRSVTNWGYAGQTLGVLGEVRERPGHDDLVADLKLLREKGLTRIRQLDLPALAAAADACGDIKRANQNQALAIERLLSRALKALGEGSLGDAARYLFGLTPGTRGRHPTELRKSAAMVWGIKADSFRKEPENRILGEIAQQIIALYDQLPTAPPAATSVTTSTADELPNLLKPDVLEGSSDLAAAERVTRNIVTAATFEDGIRMAALEIERWVFPGRHIRVGYAHRVEHDIRPGAVAFVESIVVPGDFPCRLQYPISVAGWAVAEGRIISWPFERSRMCDIERVAKLGRLTEVRSLIAQEVADPSSRLREYLELDAVLQKFENGALAIDDLYQDWSNTANEILFTQFISLPIPRIATLSNMAVPAGIGVFNIDTADDGPSLLTPTNRMKLHIVADLVYSRHCKGVIK